MADFVYAQFENRLHFLRLRLQHPLPSLSPPYAVPVIWCAAFCAHFCNKSIVRFVLHFVLFVLVLFSFFFLCFYFSFSFFCHFLRMFDINITLLVRRCYFSSFCMCASACMRVCGCVRVCTIPTLFTCSKFAELRFAFSNAC